MDLMNVEKRKWKDDTAGVENYDDISTMCSEWKTIMGKLYDWYGRYALEVVEKIDLMQSLLRAISIVFLHGGIWNVTCNHFPRW